MALASPRGIRAFIARVLVFSTLGGIAILANPFDLYDRSDDAFSAAFNRIFAANYDGTYKQTPLVILIGEESIARLYDRGRIRSNEWPLAYSDHAKLIKALVRLAPESIFIDIFFRNERSMDPTFGQLERALDVASKNNVDVFLAGGYSDQDRTPTQERLAAVSKLTVNAWRGYDQNYPLVDGGQATAAFDLYRSYCGRDSTRCAPPTIDLRDPNLPPLAVTWGGAQASTDVIKTRTLACPEPANWLMAVSKQLAFGLTNGLFSTPEPPRPPCPYHEVVHISDLIHAIDMGLTDSLKQSVEGRVLFYAVDLDGLEDRVVSPVHGSLPAVFAHAMAFDNLLTQGANYTRPKDSFSDWWELATWVAVVIAVLASQGAMARRQTGNALTRLALMCLASGVVILTSISLSNWAFNYIPVNGLGLLSLSLPMLALAKGDIGLGVLSRIKGFEAWAFNTQGENNGPKN